MHICHPERARAKRQSAPRVQPTTVRNKKPVIPSDSRGIWCPALCCSFTTQDPSAALRMTEYGFLSLYYLN